MGFRLLFISSVLSWCRRPQLKTFFFHSWLFYLFRFWAVMLVKLNPRCMYGIATPTLYQLCKNLVGFPSGVSLVGYIMSSSVVKTVNFTFRQNVRSSALHLVGTLFCPLLRMSMQYLCDINDN